MGHLSALEFGSKSSKLGIVCLPLINTFRRMHLTSICMEHKIVPEHLALLDKVGAGTKGNVTSMLLQDALIDGQKEHGTI